MLLIQKETNRWCKHYGGVSKEFVVGINASDLLTEMSK